MRRARVTHASGAFALFGGTRLEVGGSHAVQVAAGVRLGAALGNQLGYLAGGRHADTIEEAVGGVVNAVHRVARRAACRRGRGAGVVAVGRVDREAGATSRALRLRGREGDVRVLTAVALSIEAERVL